MEGPARRRAAVLLALLCLVTLVRGDAVTLVDPDLVLLQQDMTGETISCVDLRIVQGTGLDANKSAYGDGFCRLRRDLDEATFQRVLAAPDGTAVPVPESSLDGANVWLMDNLAMQGNFTVNYSIVNLPDEVAGNNNLLYWIQYVFSMDPPFDCVISEVIETPEIAAAVQFAHPSQPFGYVVVTTVPTLIPEDIIDRLWSWTAPFSGDVWGVLVGGMGITGILMWWFENELNEDDFGGEIHPARKLINGVFTAITTFTTQNAEGFSPISLPGRLYQITLSLATILTFACYIANLAAVLATQPQPMQTITQIQDFQANNVPICVLNNTAHIEFIQSSYGNTNIQVLNSTDTQAMLDAIAGSEYNCVGGLLPNVEANYYLGIGGDPAGSYCGIEVVGSPLSFGYHSIAFRANSKVANASRYMKPVVVGVINDGSYYSATQDDDFPTERPQCDAQAAAVAAAVAAAGTAPALEISDMAGIFVVQGIGMAAAILAKIYVTYLHPLIMKRRARGHSGAHGGEHEGGAEAGGEAESPHAGAVHMHPDIAKHMEVDLLPKDRLALLLALAQDEIKKMAAAGGVPESPREPRIPKWELDAAAPKTSVEGVTPRTAAERGEFENHNRRQAATEKRHEEEAEERHEKEVELEMEAQIEEVEAEVTRRSIDEAGMRQRAAAAKVGDAADMA